MSAVGPGDVGEVVFYASHGMQLKGYLYKPQGTGPFPVYMWNHGSEQQPASGARLAQFWVAAWFRAVRADSQRPRRQSGALHRRRTEEGAESAVVRGVSGSSPRLHERANDDVVAAYSWIAQQPFVDRKRIVVAGGSFGGIQALLTAQRDARDGLGVKCIVSMSPAAESWGNRNWAGGSA